MMEPWMQYEAMLGEVIQKPGAYPFPHGSASLGWLYDATDEDLQRLPLPRVRDQAISVDTVFAEHKGRYLALIKVAQAQGLTAYLDEQLSQAAHALRRMQVQQRRLRARLDVVPPVPSLRLLR